MKTNRIPTHPGALLREDILPAMDANKTEFAAALRISRQTLYDILGERQPITANLALRLGRYFGNSPEIWLGMQTAYDVASEAQRLASELEQIEPLHAA